MPLTQKACSAAVDADTTLIKGSPITGESCTPAGCTIEQEYPFVGDWGTKGCYAFTSVHCDGQVCQAYFGTGSGDYTSALSGNKRRLTLPSSHELCREFSSIKSFLNIWMSLGHLNSNKRNWGVKLAATCFKMGHCGLVQEISSKTDGLQQYQHFSF